jgi:hypothetical protein
MHNFNLDNWTYKMIGFNTFNRKCASTETLVSQSAHNGSKYWANQAALGNTTNIEQDPMHMASFYKGSSN